MSIISCIVITFILSVNAEKPDCDHVGPRPIGYCGINIMTQCVKDHDDEWFIDMIEYNDSNCNGTIIKQHQLPCLETQNCQCGKGICDNDLIITINYNDDNQISELPEPTDYNEYSMYNESSEYEDIDVDCKLFEAKFKPIVFIQNQCISGRLISDTLDHVDENLEGVILKCDQIQQELSFYEFDNIKCEGDALFDEPEILIDLIDLPCVQIQC